MPTEGFVRSSLVTDLSIQMLPPLKLTFTQALCAYEGYAVGIDLLWYMARQSSILSMQIEGFMSASSSSFFSLILLMLCPKSENWAAASSRKGITSWKFCQILISVQLSLKVCMARKHSPRIPKERFRPAPAAAVVVDDSFHLPPSRRIFNTWLQARDWKFKFIQF